MAHPADPTGRASALIDEAELRAEVVVALLRMVAATALAFSYVLTVNLPQAEVPPMMERRGTAAGMTLVAYFLLGLFSWLASRRGWLRIWMIWPAATADCLFLLANLWLNVTAAGQPGSSVFLLPSVWLAPLVLAFGALRFNPVLQGYCAVLILTGIFLVTQYEPPAAAMPRRMGAVYTTDIANVMRLTMLGVTSAVLIIAAVRTRQLLIRSIRETRHRLNLTRYLPARLASRMAGSGLADLRRGRRQEIAVLFVDMRGFTRWSQDRSPEEVSAFVTQLRMRIASVVREFGGMIDKFIGDGAMVLFENGSDSGDAALASVRCAERLAAEMEAWSRQRRQSGEGEVRVAVGLHWGEVFSGVVGGEDRLEYTVFGDTVNIAARFEELAKDANLDIVASCRVLRLALGEDAPPPWRRLPSVPVRGRTGVLDVAGR